MLAPNLKYNQTKSTIIDIVCGYNGDAMGELICGFDGFAYEQGFGRSVYRKLTASDLRAIADKIDKLNCTWGYNFGGGSDAQENEGS